MVLPYCRTNFLDVFLKPWSLSEVDLRYYTDDKKSWTPEQLVRVIGNLAVKLTSLRIDWSFLRER